MSWRRRALRVTVLVLAALVLAAAGAFLWWSRSGRPQRSGVAQVPGLTGPVEVRWDARGVPYVEAAAEEDLAAALGWLHANDRMTQMELGRRLAAGRLAELVGERAVDLDRRNRQLRLRRGAERLWREAGPRSRLWLEGYARGVNAWLAGDHGLPPGLLLLGGPGFEPEPWGPVDSLSFVFLMGEDLSFWAGRPEEERFRWLRELGEERTRDLLGGELHVPEEIRQLAAASGPGEPAPPTAPELGSAGSNNWALAPARTRSGAPLVANDPHLPLALPGTWYQVLLRSPGHEAAGMSLPGLPGVVIGRGRTVAWALTNVMLDDHDLFFEQLEAAPGGGQRVRRGEGWLPVRVEREVIAVAGGAGVPVDVLSTDHGPLLAADPERGLPARSLAWTLYHGGDPMAAFLALAAAGDLEEVLRSVGSYTGPAQNLVVAHPGGGILWTILGRIPERSSGDGRLPSPGWVTSYGWSGLRAREANPAIVAPSEGMLVTSNQPVAPAGYPFPLTADYDSPHRARRIAELLAAGGPWGVEETAAVQADVVSLWAREVVAAILPALAGDVPAAAARGRDLLGPWDGTMASRDGAGRPVPAAALFAFLERRLREGIFGDEAAAHGLAPLADRERLLRVVSGGMAESWFDDVATVPVETHPEVIAAAVAGAVADAVARWGDDPADWSYEDLHQLTLEHPLGSVPLLGRAFDRGPFPLPGSATTVMAFGARWGERGQEVTYGPSMRWITDLAQPDAAVAVLPAGQSGHPFDDHYDDQTGAWLAGRTFPFPWTAPAIEAVTTRRLRLAPPVAPAGGPPEP
jgi:acyl-homoserine lactone acylase PvdQ